MMTPEEIKMRYGFRAVCGDRRDEVILTNLEDNTTVAMFFGRTAREATVLASQFVEANVLRDQLQSKDAEIAALKQDLLDLRKELEAESAVISTPEADKLALEQNIDLSKVQGSGKGGKILMRDVQAIVNARNAPTTPPTAQP